VAYSWHTTDETAAAIGASRATPAISAPIAPRRRIVARIRRPRPRLTRASGVGVEELEGAIHEAIVRRQRLREQRADEREMELNRLELVHLQWELSHALIARHARPPSRRRITVVELG
jgi:hypothetical protein